MPSKLNLLTASLLVGIAATALGCGGGGESTAHSARLNDAIQKVNQLTAELKHPEQGGEPGPHGRLGADHFGPVWVGMTQGQVKRFFGHPGSTEVLRRDCQINAQWKWGATEVVSFGGKDRTVLGYQSANHALPTDFGVGFGGSYARLQKVYGDALSRPKGKFKATHVEQDSRRLTFLFGRDGRLDLISSLPAGCPGP